MAKPKPKQILWANLYCLLDTSSAASMTVRQMLHQLKARGWGVHVLGATIFNSPTGAEMVNNAVKRAGLSKNPIVKVNDHGIYHQLIRTYSTAQTEMLAGEESKWHSRYLMMLKQISPDVVFYYGAQPIDLLIPFEARRLHIPAVHYLANGISTGADWCQDVNKILTTSKTTAAMCKARSGVDVTPVGPFIQRSRVIANEHTRSNVLFVNRGPEKNAFIVAELAMVMGKRRPDITFEIVDSGGSWQSIAELATSYSGESRRELANVTVIENTTDMRVPYSRARLLLAPGLWWKTLPRVGIEATLNGIPGIVTHSGGMPEAFGGGALKVKLADEYYEKPHTKPLRLENIEPLINAIERFYDDETYYQSMVKTVTAKAKTHDIDKSTERLETELIATIASNGLNKAKTNDEKPPKERRRKGIQNPETKSALTPRGRAVFIDCGGFDGCSALKFIAHNPTFECITFEPNSIFHKYYTDVPTALMPHGVAAQSGTRKFLRDNIDGDGSSFIREKKIDYHGVISNADATQVEWTVWDISEVIKKAASLYDYIVLKLDIEGAEYECLQRLIDTNKLATIDHLFIEWHWMKMKMPKAAHKKMYDAVTSVVRVSNWDALDYARLPSQRPNPKRAAAIQDVSRDSNQAMELSALLQGIDE